MGKTPTGANASQEAAMRTSQRFVLFVVLIASLTASAHLCNNIYRTPDRVIVKPEKQTVTLDTADEFRVFVQNNYHTYLHNVRLSARLDGDDVNVKVEPASIRELVAGQRVSFTVKLTAGGAARRGERLLQFGIAADEIGFRPVQEPTTEELLRSANDGNHSPAIMAAESLAKLGDKRGLEKLLSFARQDNPDYRGRAIRALGKLGDRSVIAFLRGLLEERNGWIRGNALLALGLLKDEQATFEPYWQDRDEFVKAAAVAGTALAAERPPAWTTTFLTDGLAHDDVYVRIACGWALAAQRNRDGVAALDQAFRTNNPQQRTTAGDAMVDIANRAL